jgi:hypothetical protein
MPNHLSDDQLIAFTDRVIGVAYPLLKQRYRPDCCIAATRIFSLVADYFRVNCRPLSVRVIAFNPTATAWAVANDQLPVEGPEWEALVRAGAWSVGVGGGDKNPGKWPGHLAAVVDERYLVDLSLYQAYRPQHGMVLTPTFGAVTPKFLAGEAEGQVFVAGCLCLYVACPEDHSFERALDWSSVSRHDRTVADVVRALRASEFGCKPRPAGV